MKTLLYILLIGSAGTGAYFINTKCESEPYAHAVSQIVDRTDTFLSQPDSQSTKKMFSGKSLWEGNHFRLLTASDVDYNAVYETKLPPECSYFSNVYERKRKTNQFYMGIEDALAKVLSEPVGKPRSSVYAPIAHELNLLSEKNAKRKILVVYSDLAENTPLLSFYRAETLKQLKDNPDSILEVLEKQIPLPNLKGIEIYFIYKPKDEKDNEQFRIVSGFFKEFFESRGAKVEISANLVM